MKRRSLSEMLFNKRRKSKKIQTAGTSLSALIDEDQLASILENDLLTNFRQLDLHTQKHVSHFVQQLADGAAIVGY